MTSAVGGLVVAPTDPGSPTITTADFQYPGWLSSDGAEMWNYSSSDLTRSLDDGVNWTLIRQWDLPVRQVRPLPSGGLLVALQGDNDSPGEMWRSTDYNRNDPTGATWSKVLTFSAVNTYPDVWTLDVHDDVIVVGEYGSKLVGANGRYIYISTDEGGTWRSIFSWVGNPDVDGLGLHVHGCAYDPWADRIWGVFGDEQHGIAFTEDWRDQSPTWTWVSTVRQPVAVIPTADVIVFGSDDASNGVYCLRRADGEFFRAFVVDGSESLHVVAGQPYRHSAANPILMPFSYGGGVTGAGCLVASVDGVSWHLLWRDSATYDGQGLQTMIGPTASGKLVGTLSDDRQVSASRITLPAPSWSEVNR